MTTSFSNLADPNIAELLSKCFVSQLDTRGLKCPEPVMVVRQALRKLQSGDIIEVLASDPSTQRDFADFCKFMSHKLLKARVSKNEYVFLIQKGPILSPKT